jgi:hypothetical protein
LGPFFQDPIAKTTTNKHYILSEIDLTLTSIISQIGLFWAHLPSVIARLKRDHCVPQNSFQLYISVWQDYLSHCGHKFTIKAIRKELSVSWFSFPIESKTMLKEQLSHARISCSIGVPSKSQEFYLPEPKVVDIAAVFHKIDQVCRELSIAKDDTKRKSVKRKRIESNEEEERNCGVMKMNHYCPVSLSESALFDVLSPQTWSPPLPENTSLTKAMELHSLPLANPQRMNMTPLSLQGQPFSPLSLQTPNSFPSLPFLHQNQVSLEQNAFPISLQSQFTPQTTPRSSLSLPSRQGKAMCALSGERTPKTISPQCHSHVTIQPEYFPLQYYDINQSEIEGNKTDNNDF